MGWLDRLWWNPGDDEDDYEVEERRETFTLEETFTRRRIRFEFVRGGSETITHDVFDGKRSSEYDGWPRSFTDGKWVTTRGDTRVEQFIKFSGEASVGAQGDDWEDYVELHGEPTGDEVTTMNVASRHIEGETEMVVAIPCERTVKVRTDTDEQVYSGIPNRRNRDATYAAHHASDYGTS